MKQVMLTYKKTGQMIKVNRKPLRIGRGPGNHVILSSKSASRQHALVEREGDYVWVTDVGSRNGTFLNGEKLARDRKTGLAPGDEIRFGQSTTFTITGCATPMPRAPLAQGRHEKPGGQQRLFGFEANGVEFERVGVGAQTAARLGDRFRPIQVVSSGGMGKILLVQELLSGRFVAMKVMLEKGIADKSLVQQFVREAVITARLQHPHIIPVHDLGFLEGDQLYYTMSYIEGMPLGKLLPTIELPERIRILRCAALAVSHAHSKGLWHRDLKPQNILVGQLGDTYVIDWGLVSVQPGKEYKLNIPKIVVGNLDLVIPDNLLRETPDAITVSHSGKMGTPLFMAPEQWWPQLGPMGAVSDVWAFGLMLYMALTGRNPLTLDGKPNPHPLEIGAQLVDGRPFPAPSEFSSSTPERLDELCLSMLEKDPSQRLQGLDGFLQETSGFLQQQGFPLTYYGKPDGPRLGPGITPESRLQRELEALREENARLRAELKQVEGRDSVL
jgi:serine/threonine protein kinase